MQIAENISALSKWYLNAYLYEPQVICFASVCRTNMDRLSTTLTRDLIRHAIFIQTGPPWRVNCFALGNIRRKYFFQEHNDRLPSSRTETRVNNLAVADLRSYPLNCSAASWDISNNCFSPAPNTAFCPV